MPNIDIDEIHIWVRDAGTIARRYFNRVTGQRKPDRTWVTEADVAVEQYLVERITARYPDHGIIGEEQTQHEIWREFVWVLDPIDGTGSFVAGLPGWSISLGLLHNGQPIFGVIYLPLLDDCYWTDQAGAMLNGQAIQVAEARAWDGVDWLATPSNAHRRYRIAFPAKTRGIGSTAAAFCYVARGSAIGALINPSAVWDIAAGLAILWAAGGVAIGLSGQLLALPMTTAERSIPEPIIIGAEAHANNLRLTISPISPEITNVL